MGKGVRWEISALSLDPAVGLLLGKLWDTILGFAKVPSPLLPGRVFLRVPDAFPRSHFEKKRFDWLKLRYLQVLRKAYFSSKGFGKLALPVTILMMAREEYREWVEKRLKEDPDFGLPSPIWHLLGFDVPKQWSGWVSLPYTVIVTEPQPIVQAFRAFLVLERMACVWQLAGKKLSLLNLSFADDLRGLQKSPLLYTVWELFKKRSEIFVPLEEAHRRFTKEGKLTDLERVYRELWRLKKGRPEKLAWAIREGKYDL
ncbi:MAG: hypothetical protein QXR87_04145 [Candidatus Hadarchaeales archaeon]